MKSQAIAIISIAFIFALGVLGFGESVWAQVIFEDGFETGDLSHMENGAGWGGSPHMSGDSVSVCSTRAHSDTYSLKFHYMGRLLGSDNWAEQRFQLGSNRTDLYIRFYIYFPSNFEVRNDPPSNNKTIVIWANTYSGPVQQAQEFDPSTFGPKAKKSYVSGNTWQLDCDAGGIGGVSGIQGIGDWAWNENLPLGQWVCFEYHFKPDTGAGDGAMEFWVDGIKKYGATNLSWVGAPCSPGYFLNGYLMGWANSGYDEDTDIYIDDVVFSDSYIGPIEAGIKGDLTGDSLINIQDIQACVNHILATQDWGSAADVNEDSAVNVLDVQEIVNLILSG